MNEELIAQDDFHIQIKPVYWTLELSEPILCISYLKQHHLRASSNKVVMETKEDVGKHNTL